jgi:hypothetical protein
VYRRLEYVRRGGLAEGFTAQVERTRYVSARLFEVAEQNERFCARSARRGNCQKLDCELAGTIRIACRQVHTRGREHSPLRVFGRIGWRQAQSMLGELRCSDRRTPRVRKCRCVLEPRRGLGVGRIRR